MVQGHRLSGGRRADLLPSRLPPHHRPQPDPRGLETCPWRSSKRNTMSRLRWPHSMNPVSEEPDTVQGKDMSFPPPPLPTTAIAAWPPKKR